MFTRAILFNISYLLACEYIRDLILSTVLIDCVSKEAQKLGDDGMLAHFDLNSHLANKKTPKLAQHMLIKDNNLKRVQI